MATFIRHEGDTFAFFASGLDPEGNPITISFTTTPGSATPGVDYEAAIGSVTSGPNGESVTLVFKIFDDDIWEIGNNLGRSGENFFGTISNNATVNPGPFEVIIADGEDKPTLSVSSAEVTESNSNIDVAITVTATNRASKSYPITLTVRNPEGSGPDFVQKSVTVVMPAFETSVTAHFQVLGDELAEKDETYIVEASADVGEGLEATSGQVKILNDDWPTFAVATASGDTPDENAVVVTEGGAQGMVHVVLSKPADFAINFHVDTQPSGWQQDVVVSDFVIQPGETSLDIPLVSASADIPLEPIESGTLVFAATGDAGSGPRALDFAEGENVVPLLVKDQLTSDADLPGMTEGLEWVQRLINYVNSTTQIAGALQGFKDQIFSEAAGRAYAEKLDAVARFVDIAIEGTTVLTKLQADLALAKQLRNPADKANAAYAAYEEANVSFVNTLIKAALSSSGAAFVGGVVAGLTGATATAALPVLATVVVGWGAEVVYDTYIAPLAKTALTSAFESSNPKLPVVQPQHGYIVGATVFADTNMNGVLDAGEASATTDASAFALLVGGAGPLVAIGGVDIATGLPFEGRLRSPDGATIITPLTTLVVVLDDQSAANPAQKVLAAFGLDPTLELANLDPIAATIAGNTAGLAAYAAGLQVFDTVDLIAKAIDGANPGQFGDAFDDAFAALASLLTNGPVDLANAAVIETLIADTLALGPYTLADDVVDGLAEIIAEVNGAIAGVASSSTGIDALADLTAIALVAEGVAADAVKEAGANPSTLPDALNAFTGGGLQLAIGAAQSQTGDVDGPDIQNAPKARSDSYSLDEDQSLVIAASGVLANDRDADGDTLSAILVSGPAHGNLALNPDGSFSYTPDANFNGTDSFLYKANDGTADSDGSVVTINVAALNDAPTLANLIANQNAAEDSAFVFTLPADTFADVDIGDALTLAATLANGDPLPTWLTFDPVTRVFSGMPLNADVGTVTVRVTATDISLASVSDDFTLAVTNTNDAPTANPDAGSAGENKTKSFDLLANDTDPDAGDSRTLVSIGTVNVSSTNGSVNGINVTAALSIVAGQIQFSPGTLFDPLSTGETATVTVNYTMRDAAGVTASSTLTLTVNGAADGPVFNVINGTPKSDKLTGTAAADEINGLGGPDVVDARGGDDLISAGAGADRVSAGNGNDTIVATINDGIDLYDGGSGSDTLDLSQTTASATVSLGTTFFGFTLNGAGYATSTQIGADVLVDVESVIGGSGSDSITGDNLANILRGGLGNDTISGLRGNDSLFGEAGNDRLISGHGSDQMTGGPGADTYVFLAAQSHAGEIDVVTDFAIGQDHLQFQGLSVTKLTVLDVNGDSVLDTSLKLNDGAVIQLLGVSGVSDWHVFL